MILIWVYNNTGFKLSLDTLQIAKWIIVILIANLKSYEKCEGVFSQGKFNSSTLYLATLPKISLENTKSASQFLQKNFTCGALKALLRSAYLLRSEFQKIIEMLSNAINFKLNYYYLSSVLSF